MDGVLGTIALVLVFVGIVVFGYWYSYGGKK